jgi:hypothetical protein
MTKIQRRYQVSCYECRRAFYYLECCAQRAIEHFERAMCPSRFNGTEGHLLWKVAVENSNEVLTSKELDQMPKVSHA